MLINACKKEKAGSFLMRKKTAGHSKMRSRRSTLGAPNAHHLKQLQLHCSTV
jgi:hypothetical protein